MGNAPAQPLSSRLDVHDRKQFEMKLEYQPAPKDASSRYLIETFFFLPASLNIDQDTYPRASFYTDIHNYIRLKTPVMSFPEMLSDANSPLVKLERRLESGRLEPQSELIHEAKMLSCIFRAALRRFDGSVREYAQRTGTPTAEAGRGETGLTSEVNDCHFCVARVLERFRAWTQRLSATAPALTERTRASLRLVDEYMSLSVEQFFRKAVADMERLPRSAAYIDLRKGLMAKVIEEETYRRENRLRSVLSPTGDNEEYMQRLGFLKKFCMNILFLMARRRRGAQGLEEVLFAAAAGGAMAFATVVAFLASQRFSQASFNFFLILVVGYMFKDRIKEGLRKILASAARERLYDRTTVVENPVTGQEVGLCREKVDYTNATTVPEEIKKLRQVDDFLTVSQGELSETVLRYQKQMLLHADQLPRVMGQVSGVTDIVRFNVGHLLHDMDDPEYAIEYVDLEDFSVGRVKGVKSYQVDMAFRFTVDDGDERKVSTQLVRLVMDRNGIKRMVQFEGGRPAGGPNQVRSVA
ncbi:MAG TPA: hypothetical protein VIG99_16135 [Myxococcaceae bacterium]